MKLPGARAMAGLTYGVVLCFCVGLAVLLINANYASYRSVFSTASGLWADPILGRTMRALVALAALAAILMLAYFSRWSSTTRGCLVLFLAALLVAGWVWVSVPVFGIIASFPVVSAAGALWNSSHSRDASNSAVR